MTRIFCLNKDISGEKITIAEKKTVHYLHKVLRMRIDSKVEVINEDGILFRCVVADMPGDKMELEIKERMERVISPGVSITIACAIPKNVRFDDIVDKLTQLGVDRIIPLDTERVVVRLDKEKKQLRQLRWEKIALSAAKQSQRNSVPKVEPVRSMMEALEASKDHDLKLIPTLEGERKTLKDILSKTSAKKVVVFIGPEGDFTPEEVDLAINAGCIPVTLGALTFRVDTAAIAVASILALGL